MSFQEPGGIHIRPIDVPREGKDFFDEIDIDLSFVFALLSLRFKVRYVCLKFRVFPLERFPVNSVVE